MTDTLTTRPAGDLGRTVRWGDDALAVVLSVVLSVDADGPVRVLWFGEPAQQPEALPAPVQPLVEVFAVGHGHHSHNLRYTASAVGTRLRYAHHTETVDGPWSVLTVEQHDPETGLVVTSTLRSAAGVAGVQSWTEVRNDGASPITLQAVSSFTAAFTTADGPEAITDVDVISGWSEWLGENRFARTPLRSQGGLVELDLAAHQAQDARSRIAITSQGTWSSGERMPCGVVENRATGTAWAWQVEHNGAWHAELGERLHGELVLGLLGPTDIQHQWVLPLAPGETFRSIPVSVCVAAGGWERAVGVLTAHRRALRTERARPIDTDLPVIFNDYMNTLMGDPTTAKLLPLIDAAAAAGAEYFCIDAGWYDDGGDWWDSVGQWQPSTGRFPDGGLGRVIDHIRAAGMVPGLWLEPEVIGVRSLLADSLPDEAFLQRHGTRVVEQQRYHLDLRHPAARAHLDEVVDRLVADFGLGYFKLDYNITPGQGTDHDAPSPGVGLLDHNRAHLDWLDGVLARHPQLLIENCASGAQRADYSLLSRLHLQSTSDQQNLLLYPPIAAAAPLSMVPEQAANWAYPQPDMTPEQAVFTLCTGMLGRLYLAGHLDTMSPEQLAVVSEALTVHRSIREDLARAVPVWPLGLPQWDDRWVAMGMRTADATYLTVWHRGTEAEQIDLSLPELAGTDAPTPDVTVEQIFPGPSTDPGGWTLEWTPGALRVATTTAAPSARVIRLHHPT
ncbi:glycoside hydrolase family 36 protein [Actinotalea sp. C106]|uniref:glycoside hydrolase family 36 protein n=1 Tax=Actinotalea sp. C106 TaxID=2908644 RepID=UPI002029941E|nr:glycoside hydrolase family 36 protein [Actinotalea sp. C106]